MCYLHKNVLLGLPQKEFFKSSQAQQIISRFSTCRKLYHAID